MPGSTVLLRPCFRDHSSPPPTRKCAPALFCRGGSWIPLNDVSPGKGTKQVASVKDEKGLLPPYAFAFAVLFLCATAFCAFSCALRNFGAFSHGLVLCTISFRLDVVSLAAKACVRGIPYFARYDRPSKLCSLRCLTDSCLKLAPHSRHVTVCLAMLFLQWTGSGSVSGVHTAASTERSLVGFDQPFHADGGLAALRVDTRSRRQGEPGEIGA